MQPTSPLACIHSRNGQESLQCSLELARWDSMGLFSDWPTKNWGMCLWESENFTVTNFNFFFFRWYRFHFGARSGYDKTLRKKRQQKCWTDSCSIYSDRPVLQIGGKLVGAGETRLVFLPGMRHIRADAINNVSHMRHSWVHIKHSAAFPWLPTTNHHYL